MIDFKVALKTVLNESNRLSAETINVENSTGRFSAENISSKVDFPDFNNSAMDGFAIPAYLTKNATETSPVILPVKGEISAGDNPGKIRLTGPSVIKIFTGAPIPQGADAVIRHEETKTFKISGVTFVRIKKQIKKWENVRFRAENIKKGETIIEKGKQIRPQEAGLLQQCGIKKIKVTKRPRVAILATGDELIQPRQAVPGKINPGKIINVNSTTISGEVLLCGAVPLNLGIARDNLKSIRKKIARGLKEADVLLVSAGISVGEYDYVKNVFSELKVKQKFWRVAQRPGEPLFFGKAGEVLVFGLPGNTVSTLICFKEYVKPALLKMQGTKNYLPAEVTAYLEETIKVKSGRRYFLRGIARLKNGKYFVRTTGEQGSGILKSMVDANCLIIIPENIGILSTGKQVPIQPI